MAQQYLPEFEETANGLDIRFVWVEGGYFTFGRNTEYTDNAERKIEDKIWVDGFYMAVYEVTQQQWTKVMESTVADLAALSMQQKQNAANNNVNRFVNSFVDITTSLFDLDPTESANNVSQKNIGASLPMHNVNWEDAMRFCDRLRQMTGRQYTLPTGIQWEYAASERGNAHKLLYSGDTDLEKVGWYKKNAGGHLHKAGELAPNSLGLYDMSGNVWEWCKDGHIDDRGHDVPERREETYQRQYKVVCGGSWSDASSACCVSRRSYETQQTRSERIGFRIIMIP